MSLFRRNRATAAGEASYVPLARPRLHEDRLLDSAWMAQAGKKAVSQAMRLGPRTHDLFERDQSMLYHATQATGAYVKLLEERLKAAPDGIPVASPDHLLLCASVGYTIASIEGVERWLRAGYTHPIVHAGLIIYYTTNLKGEEGVSLRLAVETGYYAARAGAGALGAETPDSVLRELLPKS
ncbi:hypothetical protein [Streptomyces sp. NPDC019224]|uniref:hypothetical protein n=1 Tax=Streptomyces sp. NPDC019224 TaxID=3154484 RepID=UPI0034076ED3